MPSHGIAYDAWAGIVHARDRRRRASATCPSTCRSASTPARCSARSASSPASSRARETGEGCQLEIAQSDAAAAIDWSAARRGRRTSGPSREVTGNASDNYERRAPGTAGMRERRALPVLRDDRRPRAVHGVASRSSGRTSARASAGPTCSSSGPARSTATTPAATASCRPSLRDIFATQTTAEWLDVRRRAQHADRAGRTRRKTIADDPQFQDRMPWIPASTARRRPAAVADQVRRRGRCPCPTKAPDRRRAHRRGAARRARLRRRPDRRAARRRRPRLSRTSRRWQPPQADGRVPPQCCRSDVASSRLFSPRSNPSAAVPRRPTSRGHSAPCPST